MSVYAGVVFLAETADAVLYHLLRRREWLERSNTSNVLSSALDSVVAPRAKMSRVCTKPTMLSSSRLPPIKRWSRKVRRSRCGMALVVAGTDIEMTDPDRWQPLQLEHGADVLMLELNAAVRSFVEGRGEPLSVLGLADGLVEQFQPVALPAIDARWRLVTVTFIAVSTLVFLVVGRPVRTIQ